MGYDIKTINIDWSILEDLYNLKIPSESNSASGYTVDISSVSEYEYTATISEFKRCGFIDFVFMIDDHWDSSSTQKDVNFLVNNQLVDTITLASTSTTDYYGYRFSLDTGGISLERFIYGATTSVNTYDVNNSRKIKLYDISDLFGADGVVSCKIMTSDFSSFGSGRYATGWGWR